MANTTTYTPSEVTILPDTVHTVFSSIQSEVNRILDNAQGFLDSEREVKEDLFDLDRDDFGPASNHIYSGSDDIVRIYPSTLVSKEREPVLTPLIASCGVMMLELTRYLTHSIEYMTLKVRRWNEVLRTRLSQKMHVTTYETYDTAENSEYAMVVASYAPYDIRLDSMRKNEAAHSTHPASPVFRDTTPPNLPTAYADFFEPEMEQSEIIEPHFSEEDPTQKRVPLHADSNPKRTRCMHVVVCTIESMYKKLLH